VSLTAHRQEVPKPWKKPSVTVPNESFFDCSALLDRKEGRYQPSYHQLRPPEDERGGLACLSYASLCFSLCSASALLCSSASSLRCTFSSHSSSSSFLRQSSCCAAHT
jgi:hypothetical protein